MNGGRCHIVDYGSRLSAQCACPLGFTGHHCEQMCVYFLNFKIVLIFFEKSRVSEATCIFIISYCPPPRFLIVPPDF